MRLGFLGVGWSGRHLLEAVARSGVAEIAGIVDPGRSDADMARAVAPSARIFESAQALLASRLDGVVIATPSAMHAGQAIAALERGLAVFCQKPLARTAAESTRVVKAAERADRLLGVDMKYRGIEGVRRMAERCRSGELGRLFAADMVFHDAYGPDEEWCYDRVRAGGGCLMDRGVHLIDLALWLLGDPPVDRVDSRLFAGGRPLSGDPHEVEDYAVATLHLHGGAVVRLTCSWRVSAGREAVIEASVYGTEGAVQLRNLNGSFHDFIAEHCIGTRREILAEPPDDWDGRTVIEWAERVANGGRFDPAARRFIDLSEVLDAVYQPGSAASRLALV